MKKHRIISSFGESTCAGVLLLNRGFQDVNLPPPKEDLCEITSLNRKSGLPTSKIPVQLLGRKSASYSCLASRKIVTLHDLKEGAWLVNFQVEIDYRVGSGNPHLPRSRCRMQVVSTQGYGIGFWLSHGILVFHHTR